MSFAICRWKGRRRRGVGCVMGVFGRWGRGVILTRRQERVEEKKSLLVFWVDLFYLHPISGRVGNRLLVVGMHALTSTSSPKRAFHASLSHVRQASLVPGGHDAVENLARPDHSSAGPVNCRLREVLGPHDTASDVVDSLQHISQFLVRARKAATQPERKYIPI